MTSIDPTTSLRRRTSRRARFLAAASALLASTSAYAQTYNWTGATNNHWNNAGNWSPSSPGNGAADIVVDASTLDLTAARTFNLNNGTTTLNRTVGTIKFGDTNAGGGSTFNWTFAPNSPSTSVALVFAVTTGTGTFEVVNGTTTASTIIAGTQGLTKTGAGTLSLTNAGNTLTGGIFLTGGGLTFVNGALGTNTVTTSNTVTLTWNAHLTDISNKLILSDGSTTTLAVSNTAGDNTTFASALQTGSLANATVVKGNASNLTLTAANTWTGGTRVNNGRLILAGGDNRLSSAGGVTLGNGGNSGVLQLGNAAGASNQTVTTLATSGTGTSNAIVGGHTTVSTLTVNAATNLTFAGGLGGSGTNENNLSLVKSGTGTLSLTGTSSYAGTTAVNSGVLRATPGSIGTGAVTVADGARLTTLAGATSLTLSSLSLGTAAGGQLGFELNGNPTLSPIVISTTNGLSTTGTTSIFIASSSVLTAGQQFPLIDYTGAIGGAGYGSFTLGSLPNRVTAELFDNVANSSVDLKVLGIDTIKWTGANSAIWDIDTTENWKTVLGNTVTKYLEPSAPGDAVTFDDSAAVAAGDPIGVTLNGTVLPAGVTFNNASSTYTISGTGKISGTTALTKLGAGTAILTTDNDYTGNTTISAGTLQLGNGGTTGSIGVGPIVNNGTLTIERSNNVTLSNAISGTGTLVKNGSNTLTLSGEYSAGAVTINAGTLALPGGTFAAPIGGAGALLKNTAGTLVLSGTNTYQGGTGVVAGALAFANAASVPASGVITLGNNTTLGVPIAIDQNFLANRVSVAAANVATLALGVDNPNDLNFSATGPLVRLGAIGNVVYSGTLTPNGTTFHLGGGGGALTVSSTLSGANALSIEGGSTVVLSGVNTFTGGTTVLNGTTLTLANSAALGTSSAALTLTNGTLNLNGNNVAVGSLSSAAAGTITDNSAVAGTTTFAAGRATGSDTFSGSINNGSAGRLVALVKQGASTLILNKANGNTYGGGTFVDRGRLEIRTNNAQVLPNGSNLTFRGDGTFAAANNGAVNASLVLGQLAFQSGEATVETNKQNANATGSTLTFAAAPTRSAGAVGNFTLVGTTDPSVFKTVFTAAPTDGESLNGGIYFGEADFAAYDAAGYVRALSYPDTSAVDVALAANQATFGAVDGKDVQVSGAGFGVTAQPTESVRSLKIASANPIALDTGATLTITGGGIIATGGTSAISGGAAIATAGDLVVRTVLASDTLTIGTPITSAGLTKSGLGTLELATANTYTGATVIHGGTLRVNNTSGSATGAGPVYVNDGATLAGSGTISGPLTIAAAGVVSPGNSVGTLTAAGAEWQAAGAYLWEINDPSGTAGAGWDLLELGSGTLKVSATPSSQFTIQITQSGAIDPNLWFTIAHAGAVVDASNTPISTAAIAGLFNLPTNLVGESWEIRLQEVGSGGGYNVQISPVPEPSAITGLGIGVLGLLARRNRRRA